MGSIVMRRRGRVLLLRRPGMVKGSSLGQRGLHGVEVSQSQRLLLLTGDKVGRGRLEAGLGLRVHIRGSRSCLPKVLPVVLSWDSLVRLYLDLVRVAL